MYLYNIATVVVNYTKQMRSELFKLGLEAFNWDVLKHLQRGTFHILVAVEGHLLETALDMRKHPTVAQIEIWGIRSLSDHFHSTATKKLSRNG